MTVHDRMNSHSPRNRVQKRKISQTTTILLIKRDHCQRNLSYQLILIDLLKSIELNRMSMNQTLKNKLDHRTET